MTCIKDINALALDLSASLRNVVADGGIGPGPVRGDLGALEIELGRIEVLADRTLPVHASLRPVGGGAEVALHGELTTSSGLARLRMGTDAPVAAGHYDLAVGLGDGPRLGAKPVRVVGRSLTVETAAEAARSRSTSPVDRLPPSIGRVLRGVRRRLRG